MEQSNLIEALRQWRELRRPEALGELLKAHRDRAYSIAVRIMGSDADAEDVVQEAFIKLLSRTHGFENMETFETSVYRAIVQCALDARRKLKRRLVREMVPQQAPGKGGVPVPQAQFLTDETEQAESQALLREAVTRLPDEQRAPVVLCFYQGLSVSQVARTLEIPRGTVRARLARALTVLRQHLKLHGKTLGVSATLALLWQDGVLAAPASLCAALDRTLPGPSCVQVNPVSRLDPVDPATLSMAWTAGSLSMVSYVAMGVVLVSSLLSGLYLAGVFPPSRLENQTQIVQAAKSRSDVGVVPSGQSIVDLPRLQPGKVEQNNMENESMNNKLGAVVLAAGMAFPVALSAGEPNADAARVIDQIAARRGAKEEAAASAVNMYQKGGAWGEREGKIKMIMNQGANGNTLIEKN